MMVMPFLRHGVPEGLEVIIDLALRCWHQMPMDDVSDIVLALAIESGKVFYRCLDTTVGLDDGYDRPDIILGHRTVSYLV